MLEVPAKYGRVGLKVKCLTHKCKRQVTPDGTCPKTGKKMSACPYQSETHRYNLVVCVPKAYGMRRTKILKTASLQEALQELGKFRTELDETNYKPHSARKMSAPTTLVDFTLMYLDSLSGENTPEHLIRIRSASYVNECRLCIERFIISLKEKRYSIETLTISQLTDTEVAIFHEYLKSKKFSQRTYNKHMVAMKALLAWAIRVKDQKVSNPFLHVELKQPAATEPALITKEEFHALINIITPEYGRVAGSTKQRSYYQPWLKQAIAFALESGLRREEIFTCKWSDVVELEQGKLVIRVQNLKVNRILGQDAGRVKFVPVTKSLRALLDELSYEANRMSTGFIIERPVDTDMLYLCDSITRGFAHYIKQVTNRKLDFKCLRKTYITHLTVACGENSKIFSGHSNNEVLKRHYLSSAILAGNLCNLQIL